MRVGRYEIVGELGRGGMARVHLARQLDLDRFAALKELAAFDREDAEMAARFLRESRLAGTLNHPSVVTVLDFFEHDGRPYIAMEYIPRGSLRPWVGHLDLAQIGGVLENVLAGLAHAHAHSVVHRDLKPENLMVTAEGRIKITDFGIAKALTDNATAAFRTATGVMIGTPAYMAPEQAMGENVGSWTDLYATGVIAYELLCGSVPFSSAEPMAILVAHLQQEPPPLAERAPDAPPAIAAWVHALLAKDPGERPHSARDAWEELEEHLLDSLGPRWRRHARIEGEPAATAEVQTPSGRPLTPARFPATDDTAPPRTPPPQTSPPAAGPPPQTPPPAADTPPPSPPPRRGRRGVVVGAVVAVAAIVAVVVVLAMQGENTPPPSTDASNTSAPAASEPVALGSDWIRAVHIISYDPTGLTKPAFVDALRRAKADGASHVVLHPLLYAPSIKSAELSIKDDGPTDATLGAGIDAAKREGLGTIIQPFVEPKNSYAGAYEPADPNAFFDAYTDRLGVYADLAGQHGADGLVLGTMLSQLDGPKYTERWSALLTHGRERCSCQVSYSAEDIEIAERIEFWGDADIIGLSPNAPLTEKPSDDVDVLVKAWQPTKRRLQALSARWDKPVMLVDLGYTDRADQAAASVYEAKGKVSEAAQSALYEAAFRAFQGTPWFRGIGWFELNGDGAQPEPGDYGFAGKPAEAVLRAWHTAD